MYKLIRFYNQNRKAIFKIILIIVFAIGIIQLLNYFIKVKNLNINRENNIVVNNSENYQELISDKSATSNESLPSKKLERETNVIKKFVDYCNNGDINLAYELLTAFCKEEMFPTIDDFYNIYYYKLFNGDKKIYTIENWNSNVYQVRFTGDILSTGDLSNIDTKQDYITVINEYGEDKLNINNYIGRSNLNKVTDSKDIRITIKSIDIYMDYEIYDLYVENNSTNDILLDTSNDTKSVYLSDINGMKYYFFSNEIIENKLLIKSKFSNDLEIKFNNSYTSNRKINSLVFSKLVLDYNEYKKVENQEYNYYQFRVNI